MPGWVCVPCGCSCEPSRVWGLGSASQGQVGVSRKPDSSFYEGAAREAADWREGCGQGTQGWLRSRALALGCSAPGLGAVLRSPLPTRSHEAL